MNDIPWGILAIALFVVFGIFIVLKSFKMPASFSQNEQKRQALKKRLLKVPDAIITMEKEPNSKQKINHK